MLYVIATITALILMFHEVAIKVELSLRVLVVVAIAFLLLAALVAGRDGSGELVTIFVFVFYELLVYVAVRHMFKRFEGRDLQAALWNANLDRKLYIDWYWWIGWVVFAMVLPTIFLNFWNE